MDIVNEKTFQFGQRQGKKNRRWCGKRRDLVGNKVLFSSQRDQIANGFIHQIQALQRSPCQRVRSSATCHLLAPLKTKLTWIPSLSSYPHLTGFVSRLYASRPCFCLRSLVGFAIGLAIKWPVALPSSTIGSSRWKSSYRRSSHRRCDFNTRQSYLGGRKNNRLRLIKNLLTQRELRRKTKIEMIF